MESAELDRQTDRTVYFDYLRVFATFAVIILHISAQNWYIADVNGFERQTFNFFDGIVRWSVPVFVMISGALFLNRDLPLKKIYSKYISRMVISFVVWSVIYSLFESGTAMQRISSAIEGHYHMWFILMITGIYMCIPFIKAVIHNDFNGKYYLVLAFIFAFIIPEALTLADDFGSRLIIKGADAISNGINNMDIHIVIGYASYFILGYYLNKITFNRKQRIIIYAMGLFGFTATVVLNSSVALKTQEYCSHYYEYFTVNVLFEAAAVFTWFKYRKFDNEKLNFFMKKMSKYSFGAYLVHALIIEQLDKQLGLNTLSFNPVLAVFFITVTVFAVSFGISAVLSRISIFLTRIRRA